MSSSAPASQSITSKLKSKIIRDLIAERYKYVTSDESEDKKGDEFVQLAAAGIGFAPEVIHHYRYKETQKHSKQGETTVLKIQKHPRAGKLVHI